MEDLVSIADALVINIGTLNERVVRSMRTAMAAAARKGVPILLDPVGAGASRLRTDTARAFIAEFPLAAIRGNASEIGVVITSYSIHYTKLYERAESRGRKQRQDHGGTVSNPFYPFAGYGLHGRRPGPGNQH